MKVIHVAGTKGKVYILIFSVYEGLLLNYIYILNSRSRDKLFVYERDFVAIDLINFL